MNSNDDEGVVVGNWSSEFGSYTPPYKWTGSAKILQEYLKTKTPVRYGQCWVFAGVLTTGLPLHMDAALVFLEFLFK